MPIYCLLNLSSKIFHQYAYLKSQISKEKSCIKFRCKLDMLFCILSGLKHTCKDVLEALARSSLQNFWKRDKIKYKFVNTELRYNNRENDMAQTYFFNVFKREGFNLKKYHIVPLRIFYLTTWEGVWFYMLMKYNEFLMMFAKILNIYECSLPWSFCWSCVRDLLIWKMCSFIKVAGAIRPEFMFHFFFFSSF